MPNALEELPVWDTSMSSSMKPARKRKTVTKREIHDRLHNKTIINGPTEPH